MTGFRVLLVVCLYENNFGDILIYRTIRNKLELHGFTVSTIEVSESTESSRFIESANASDFVYFVGGGIIERSAPDIIRNFDRHVERLRTPYGVVGLSCGEFLENYLAMSRALTLFCDRAAFFYTRDEESVQVFKRCGASNLPVASADVVFSNSFGTNFAPAHRHLTANFRNVPYPDVTGDLNWERWSEALIGIGTDFLTGDCSDAQRQLRLPVSTRPILHDLMGSKVVVAMRFHVILVAAMLGIPAIAVCYCPKVLRLAHQLGLEDYALDIHDSGRLGEVYASLTQSLSAVRIMLVKRVAALNLAATGTLNASINAMLAAKPAATPFFRP